MTQEERAKARVAKGIANRVASDKWSWKGTRFENRVFYSLGNVCVISDFVATFSYIKVIVYGEFHNLPDVEKTFRGDEAVNEAVIWAAEKYLEMYHIVQARIAPYEAGRQAYERAYRGI